MKSQPEATKPSSIKLWFHWWFANSLSTNLVVGIFYAGFLLIAGVVLAGGSVLILLIPGMIIIILGFGIMGKVQQHILKQYLEIKRGWTWMIILASILGLGIAYFLARGNNVFLIGAIQREAGVYRELVTTEEKIALDNAIEFVIKGQQITIAIMGTISIGQWLFLSNHLTRAFWLPIFTILGSLLSVYIGGWFPLPYSLILIVICIQASQATALAIAWQLYQSPPHTKRLDLDILAIGLVSLLFLAVRPISWGLRSSSVDVLTVERPVLVEQVNHPPMSVCVTQPVTGRPQTMDLMVQEEETQSLNLLSNQIRTGHTERIKGMSLSPNGRHLVTTSNDLLKVWDIFCGEEILSIGVDHHTKSAPGSPVLFTPDGTKIVSDGRIGGTSGVKVWDASTGEELLFIEQGVSALAVTADGKRIVAGGDESLFVWELETGALLIEKKHNHRDEIYDVAVTPDMRWAVTAGYDGIASVWNLNEGELHFTFEGHKSPVITVETTPDSQWAVTGDASGNMKVWNLLTGQEQYSVDTAAGWLTDLAISQDGKYIVTASEHQTRVWNLATGTEVESFADRRVKMIRLTPDNKYILSINYSGEFNVWEMPHD